MNETKTLPTLPIPLISSLILGFLLLRIWLMDRRHGLLAALLAGCAVQGLIMSLAQHYHVQGMFLVQPITATVIPPLAWVAFQGTAVRHLGRADALHLWPPLVAIALILLRPELLNIYIPALFFGFGGAILWVALKGADALPRLSLEAGDLPGRIWQIIGVAVIASGMIDVLIILGRALGAAHLQPWIISIYATVMLLVVGVLSLSHSLVPATPTQEPPVTPPVSDLDTEIFARLEALMQRDKLYLDPDLTLTQLSRRLVVPVKQVSAAINKVTGENVSRYINNARIAAAQAALLAGDTVTSAMLTSGFNTKSNFNREFLRVTGQSPRDWLQAQPSAPDHQL